MGKLLKYIFVIFLFLFFTPQLSVQADQFEIKDDLIQFFDKPTLDGRMVFSVKLKDKGNHDLWIMDADGSNIRHLTDTDYNEVDPTISPDGQYVAFAHDREGDWRIGIMNIDNPDPNDPWPITFYDDQRHPDWGDNGLIVFQSNQEGKWSIWSKNPFMKGDLYGQDLKEESNLMVQDGVEVENDIKRPSYSKDGRYLAFATNRDGQNPDNRINRIWVLDRQTRTSKSIPRNMVKQGDDPEFYKGRNWYPDANGLPVIAFVQIKDGKPTIRWSNIDGSGGGRLTDRMPGNIAAKNPKFGPERSQEVLAFLTEKSPNAGWKIAVMDIHRGQNMPPVIVTPPSMGASIDSFDWGPFPGKNTRSGSQGTKMNPGGTRNNMNDLDEERRIKQNELENEMRRLEEDQRLKRQEMEMELRRKEDLSREEENRLRREMEMEMERERMEMEREMMEMDMEMERERMEQQREMMRNMDGDGGRDDFFEPDERCFIENEEESRGLFGNIEIGSEIDCNETQGMQDRLRDPTTLAMLGLVVTVGATMLQMLRGN